MSHRAIATLQEILRPHLELSKSRRETLCLLVVGMISGRTVNLSHLASERPGTALIASTYRRLQRFFQHVRLPADWAVPLIVNLLGLAGSWDLALDRTQWRIGAKDGNVLVLAAITRHHRVPLIWTALDKRGNSATDERVALLRRYLELFEVSTIRRLLADREFVGREWLEFLCENNIDFAIRLKETLRVTTEEGHELTLLARLRRSRCRSFRARLGLDDGAAGDARPLLNFAAKPLKDGEWLIVVCNGDARKALQAYRKRWAIECLFGDAKTRGVNLEDTRLTAPRKLELLLALVALALAWAGRVAVALLGPRMPKRKAHGHFAKSVFRTGFDEVRRLLRTNPAAAVTEWRRLAPKPPRKPRVV
jgi:Transposase DDE domain